MTFGNLKKMFDIINNGGEILVMEDISEGQANFDDEYMHEVENCRNFQIYLIV